MQSPLTCERPARLDVGLCRAKRPVTRYDPQVTAALQLTPGMIVGGDFEVERILEAGGMGAVYVARQRSTGKTRALKVMHPQLVADERLRERFEQEARIGALIRSSHVVEVIGAGIDPGSGAPWIAMELLEGTNLAQHAIDHGCLSPGELLEVLRQVCHALGAAHDVGVVHRDVKPENIVVTRAQTVGRELSIKVLDFGIAKVAAQVKTTATSTVGSPAWMAPEQTDPSVTIGPPADVWALGLMAFWLLTGRSFWSAANNPSASMHALMREILFGDLPVASERAGELGVAGRLPEGFDGWFARCVARDPTRRFESANELFDAFERMLGEPTRRTVVHTSIPPSSRSPGSLAHGATEPLGPTTPPEAPPSSRPLSLTAVTRVDGVKDAAPVSTTTEPMKVRPVASPTAPPLVSEAGPPTLRAPSLRRPGERRNNLGLVGAGALVAAAITWSALRAAPEGSAGQPVVLHSVAPSAVAPSDPTVPPDTAVVVPLAPTRSAESSLPPAESAAPGPSAAPVAAPSTKRPPSPAPKVEPQPRAFDHRDAHRQMQQAGSMASRSCGAHDGPRAFTVSVAFRNDGTVRRVTSHAPGSPGVSATQMCAHAPFFAIRVAPFDGSEVVVSTGVHVL